MDTCFGYGLSVLIFHTMFNSCCAYGMDVRMLGFSISLPLSQEIRPDEKCGPKHSNSRILFFGVVDWRCYSECMIKLKILIPQTSLQCRVIIHPDFCT